MRTHISRIEVKGVEKFVLDIRHSDGRRQRHTHDTRRAAEIEQESLQTQIAISGEVWTSLNAREQAEVLFAIREVQEMGVSVREVVESYKAHRSRKHRAIPLGQVVLETLQTARNQNCRERYTDTLALVLNRFAKGREQMPITRILSEVENFLGAQTGKNGQGKAAPSTIIGLRSKLCALFAEAVRREYIDEMANPMRRVLCPKFDPPAQPFFKPNEFHDLLWVCRQTDPAFLAWLVLGTFAGVRPEELEKLKWDAVCFSRNQITIDETVAKTRRRRIIEMKDCGPMKEWLAEAMAGIECNYIVPVEGDRSARVVMRQIRQMIKRHRARLCERAGIEWKSDIMRKTACTYLMALHESADKVALLLGNSPKIIHQHYRGLARRDETDAFWNLTPDKVKNDPIAIPAGGYGKAKTGKLI